MEVCGRESSEVGRSIIIVEACAHIVVVGVLVNCKRNISAECSHTSFGLACFITKPSISSSITVVDTGFCK